LADSDFGGISASLVLSKAEKNENFSVTEKLSASQQNRKIISKTENRKFFGKRFRFFSFVSVLGIKMIFLPNLYLCSELPTHQKFTGHF